MEENNSEGPVEILGCSFPRSPIPDGAMPISMTMAINCMTEEGETIAVFTSSDNLTFCEAIGMHHVAMKQLEINALSTWSDGG